MGIGSKLNPISKKIQKLYLVTAFAQIVLKNYTLTYTHKIYIFTHAADRRHSRRLG